MVLLELFREAGEGKASSLLPVLSGLSLSRSEPFAWVPWRVYIGLPPGGTIVIRLGTGPSRLSLRPPSSPPASGAHLLAGPADRLDTVVALLMTQAWSLGRGNSNAVYQAITVATPHPIWFMACGALEGRRPTPGRPTPTGPSSGALAAFDSPTDGWPRGLRAVQAGVVGTVRGVLWLRSGQAWQQCRASPEIFSDTAYCSHAGPL